MLVEEDRFELSAASIAWRLNLAEGAAESCDYNRILPRINANPVLISHFHARLGAIDGALNRTVVIDFEAEGTPCRDVQAALQRGGLSWVPFSNCAMDDGVLMLHSTSDIVFVPHDQAAPPQRLTITRDIKSDREKQFPNLRLKPAFETHLIAQGNIVPVPLQAGGLESFIAYLHVDTAKACAKWSTTPKASDQGLLASLFSGVKPTPSPIAQVDLVQLQGADFPKTFLQGPPYFNQVILQGPRSVVFSKGVQGQPRDGLPFGSIAEITAKGALRRQIYLEDYSRTPGMKKYGFDGHFTTSGQYFVRRPIYAARDICRGKPALVDLETGEIAKIKLPKEISTAFVQDHLGSVFWAILPQNDRQIVTVLKLRKA